MKRVRGVFLAGAIAACLAGWAGSSWGSANVEGPGAFSHESFTAVLARFVEKGAVDYRGLQRNRKELELYLDRMADVKEDSFLQWKKEDRMAFLINLYNASTLRLILDHYPVKGIKDIGGWFKGPWGLPVVRLWGGIVTLNELEHGVLRERFNDPRIHAALVCAAKGCPPLRPEAYEGERLDGQLTDQMRLFLADRAKNRIDEGNRTVYLSLIFKWYKEDFEKGGGSLLRFLQPYWPEREAGLFQGEDAWSVKYTGYDWSLNEKEGKAK